MKCMKKLTHQEIVARQERKAREPKLPFCVVLNNIRSAYNVGSIFRTADGSGVEKIWLCGISGCPPNREISKTALGAEEQVAWEYRQDAVSLIKELKNRYEIVLLEQTQQSIPCEQFCPTHPVCLILGHEVEGVTDDLLSYCDRAIEIEMAGVKNSLNVSVAFGIVSYHIRGCFKKGVKENVWKGESLNNAKN